MKNLWDTKNLPAITAGLGGIALVLRRLLYAFGVDGKGLLVTNHPLGIALLVLTGAALILIAVSARKLDGSNEYNDNFSADVPAMVGHLAAAAGIGLTMLTSGPLMYGYLGQLWQILGYLSPVCLVLAGLARMRGKRPFFALHLIPSLFLALHIINHYQTWSGNPQLQDYVFTLFGTMALMLFAFYTGAFSVDAGNRKRQLGMGLAAVYLCMAELATTGDPWLYTGGILWALTGLCSLTPVPKKEPEPENDAGEEG